MIFLSNPKLVHHSPEETIFSKETVDKKLKISNINNKGQSKKKLHSRKAKGNGCREIKWVLT